MQFNPAFPISGSSVGETLISSYVVSGVSWNATQVTIDTTTDTLTILNHGMVNGDTVGFGVFEGNDVPKTGQTSGTQLFVINATINTFQLSATNGGASLDFTTTGGSDWKLFKNTGIGTITFSNVNYKKIRVKMRGNAVVGSPASRVSVNRNSDFQINTTAMPTSTSSKPDYFDAEFIMESNSTGGFYTISFRGTAYARGMLTGGGVNLTAGTWINSKRYTTDQGNLGTVVVQIYGSGSMCAGTVVEVYGIE